MGYLTLTFDGYLYDDTTEPRQTVFRISNPGDPDYTPTWEDCFTDIYSVEVPSAHTPSRGYFTVYTKWPFEMSVDNGATWTPVTTSIQLTDGTCYFAGAFNLAQRYNPVPPTPKDDYVRLMIGLNQAGAWYQDTTDWDTVNDYLFNGDHSMIVNYEQILQKVKCCLWTLYLDSNTYYLTWYSPYIEDTHGNNNVYPYDVNVELKSIYDMVGPVDPTIDFSVDYSAEPYVFTYRGLLGETYPTKVGQWLAKAIDSVSFMDTGDLTLYARLSWKETNEQGTTTTTYTNWVSMTFDPKWLVSQLFTHTSESIKSYTPTVADGSTLTLKDGLPNDDPDFHTADWNGLEYTTDDDYEDPSESEDTWTEPGDYYTNNTLTRTYAMTSARLDALGSFMWGNSFYSLIHSINNSPIENIVGLYAFPFDLSGTDEEIYLGNVGTGVQGAKISNTYNPTVSVGTVTVGGIYESFLDLEPYTRLYIFLPFIGLKQLDISRCHGRSLSLEYVPDLVTGITSANIYLDGKLEYVFSCQMGIQIPLNATNAGQVAGGVLSNLASTAVLAAANIAAENYIGAVGVIAGGGVAAATAKVTTETSGAHSANCWSKMPRTAFLLYDRPVYQNLAMFNHTYGRMCNLSKQLGSLKGFTQVSNIDLSGIQIATKQEADEIRDLLREGVWL
jgi:hypothetical protein